MNIEFSKSVLTSLVEERPDLESLFDGYTFFCTISPNPKTMVETTRKNLKGKIVSCKQPYASLPQRVQYQFCMRFFARTYLSLCKDPIFLGVPELNKQGNVHLHFILKDCLYSNPIGLEILRRDILNCPETLCNIKATKRCNRDYMNNIVHLTKSKADIMAYLIKTNEDAVKYFENFCSLKK